MATPEPHIAQQKVAMARIGEQPVVHDAPNGSWDVTTLVVTGLPSGAG